MKIFAYFLIAGFLAFESISYARVDWARPEMGEFEGIIASVSLNSSSVFSTPAVVRVAVRSATTNRSSSYEISFSGDDAAIGAALVSRVGSRIRVSRLDAINIQIDLVE